MKLAGWMLLMLHFTNEETEAEMDMRERGLLKVTKLVNGRARTCQQGLYNQIQVVLKSPL